MVEFTHAGRSQFVLYKIPASFRRRGGDILRATGDLGLLRGVYNFAFIAAFFPQTLQGLPTVLHCTERSFLYQSMYVGDDHEQNYCTHFALTCCATKTCVLSSVFFYDASVLNETQLKSVVRLLRS